MTADRCKNCNYRADFCVCTDIAATQVDGYDGTPDFQSEYARQINQLEEGAERNSRSSAMASPQVVDAVALTRQDIEQLAVAWYDYSQNGCPSCADYLDAWLEAFVRGLLTELAKMDED